SPFLTGLRPDHLVRLVSQVTLNRPLARLRNAFDQGMVDTGGEISPRVFTHPFGEPSPLCKEQDARHIPVQAVTREGSHPHPTRLEVLRKNTLYRESSSTHSSGRHHAGILFHDQKVIVLVKKAYLGVKPRWPSHPEAIDLVSLLNRSARVLERHAVHRDS